MAQSTSDLSLPRIAWPEGRAFAFSIFDDPDYQTRERGEPVYRFLADLGFRTTRGVFPGTGATPDADRNVTCLDPRHAEWLLDLQRQGFEIGWHGASPGTSLRAGTEDGLERFRSLFGAWPKTIATHFECSENIYWGADRLSGTSRRFLYNCLTRWKNSGSFHGHIPGHPEYWSDLCRERVRYMRNFVYSEIDTLAACPFMPYHDPERPDVNLWYASADGHDAASFIHMLSRKNLDRLEVRGGACIMYTHFAYQFCEGGKLNPAFRAVMEDLAKRPGWFVPVGELLDYIGEKRGPLVLNPRQRALLERRWLMEKILRGTA